MIGDVLLRRRFIILRNAFIDCCDYLPNHMLNYVSINVLTVYLMSMKSFVLKFSFQCQQFCFPIDCYQTFGWD